MFRMLEICKKCENVYYKNELWKDKLKENNYYTTGKKLFSSNEEYEKKQDLFNVFYWCNKNLSCCRLSEYYILDLERRIPKKCLMSLEHSVCQEPYDICEFRVNY